MFIVYVCNRPLVKRNSIEHTCKLNREKEINFRIVGASFRKEVTSSGRLFLRFIQFRTFSKNLFLLMRNAFSFLFLLLLLLVFFIYIFCVKTELILNSVVFAAAQ